MTSDITIGDLRAGVSDREKALRSFSMTAHLDSEVRLEGRAITLKASEEIEVTAETDGRIRYDSSGVVIDASGNAAWKMQGTFDGTEARFMRARDSENYQTGEVAPTRSGVSFRVDPLELVSHYFGSLISTELANPNAEIVARESLEGESVYVVEISHAPPPDGKDYVKSRFWVVPSWGFVVVKRAALARRSADSQWTEYYRVVGTNHREIQSGIWLPMQITSETINVTDTSYPEGAMVLNYKLNVKNWNVNQELGEAIFTFAFPVGVFVTDRIHGRTYQVSRVGDQDLFDQQGMPSPDGKPRTSLRWILIVLNISTVAILLLFYAYRKSHQTRT